MKVCVGARMSLLAITHTHMHVVVVVVVLSTDEHVLCSEHALYVLLCGGSAGV